MKKFKKHFTKSFEELLGKEEIGCNYKGRKFTNCFKKLAETINIDIEEIRTEIFRSNQGPCLSDDAIYSEVLSNEF